jgi:hypothetical protein
MKKIMFILAFVGIGLFASASNGKIEKIKLPIKKELKSDKVSIESLKSKPNLQYYGWVTCGGHTYTICCFSSYGVALYAAGVLEGQVCN